MYKKYKNLLLTFMRTGLSPAQIAFGVSLGNFVGILPFLGLHTVMALGLAYLLRLNMGVVFLGTQISNPFSFPFILFISAQIGNLLLNGSFLSMQFTADTGILKQYVVLILIGSIVLGLAVALISYPLTLRLARRFRS